MARQTKECKAMDKLVERLYGESCSGIQIPLMDIPRVFQAGRTAIAEGKDVDGVRAAIVAFVASVRVN